MGYCENMTNRAKSPFARLARRAVVAPTVLLAASLTTLTACDLDSILEVTDPDVATPATIRDPENLQGLRVGALGDFQVAYAGNTIGGGGTEGVILSAGLLADELYVSDTFGTRREVDRRDITLENAGMLTVFRNLHRARRAAEVAADMYAENQAHGRYNAAEHAEVTSLAGYTYLMFAENWCSGVPFSSLTLDNRIEHGQPQTTAQMLDNALSRFQAARNLTTNATQLNVARIGEARTLLNMNRPAEAAAAVAAVPTGFVYEMQYSENTARQNNGVWGITHNRRGYGVAHLEGGNGLPFRMGNSNDPASQDPRVRYTRTRQSAIDAPYAHFWQLKYPQRSSSIPLATGIEARLIEAEAALRANDVATFVSKHNELRARVDGLTPLVLADVQGMSQAARVDLHFQERGFWLFLTANRLADMRRLVRQYNRPTESVFPTGTFGRFLFDRSTPQPNDRLLDFAPHGPYGSDVNFPVPFDELNNPNFDQCINRNA
jgi:starch-binding outer membrane protein, SusD/RagB family